jgi:hypothetical protein
MTTREKCKSIYWSTIKLLEMRKTNKEYDEAIFNSILQKTEQCDFMADLTTHRQILRTYAGLGDARITPVLDRFSAETTRLLVSGLPLRSQMFYYTICRLEKNFSN